MNSDYIIECPICDITTTVYVKYEEEEPRFCPMCGSDADAEQEEREED
jgi:uncharacterized Zn finger protein (UPF0148 family)